MATKTILWLLLGTWSDGIPVGIAGRSPVLNILVTDQTGVSDGVLGIATEVAGRVLAQAGVAVNWVICAPAQPHREPRAGCRAETDAPDLIVRMIAAPLAGHRVGATATGMALLGEPGERASFTFVYYDRVSRLAGLGAFAVHRVLGHVMAHEIAHLLGAPHSLAGIMSARWHTGDVRKMSTGYLLFRPEEARALRQNTMHRVTRRTAPD
jgi:hypothetical protein